MVMGTCALGLCLDAGRRSVSVAAGGVAPTPVRAPAAEAFAAAALDWDGRGPLGADVAGRFAELVLAATDPQDDVRGNRGLPPPRARRAGAPLPRLDMGGAPVRLTCTVNGVRREADVAWEGESLLRVLRDRLGLAGTKNACEQGSAAPARSISTARGVRVPVLAAQAEGSEILTVEGLGGKRSTAVQGRSCRRRRAVRLLHARHDRQRARPPAPRRPTPPTRRSAPRCRQPVPLHGLPQDPRRRAARGERMSTAERLVLEGCAIAIAAKLTRM